MLRVTGGCGRFDQKILTKISPLIGGWTFWTLVVKLKSQKITFWTFWTEVFNCSRTALVQGSSNIIFSDARQRLSASEAGYPTRTSPHPRPSATAHDQVAFDPECEAWLSYLKHTKRLPAQPAPAHCAPCFPSPLLCSSQI